MNREEHDPRFEELDEQIRRALHVEVASEQLDRVQRCWHQRCRAARRRRRIQYFVALAAAILLVTALLYLPRDSQLQEPVTQSGTAQPSDSPPSRQAASSQPTAEQPRKTRSALHQGRSPTHYERLLFTARMRTRQMARRRVAVTAIENAIAALVADPHADPQQLLDATGLQSAPAETLLLQQVGRSDIAHKQAILQLLEVCGSRASTATLIDLAERQELRREALEALEQTVGAAGLARAASQSSDVKVRSAIYHRLFNDEATLDAFLSLVQDDRFSGEALAVVDRLSSPTIQALLDRLNHADRSTRLAAALVLGRANGPRVTRSLITLVSENPASSEEAWIALMACRGAQADRFLAYAEVQPTLLGPLNRARSYWARMIH
jgi:hypothetical protein